MIATLLTAMRPVHWAKNALVFVPVLAAHRAEMAALMQGLAAFAALSLAASAIYLVNDIADREADRAHPRKRARPLAAGRLPVPAAAAAALVLALAGTAFGAWAGGFGLAVAVLGYLLSAAAYAVSLKRVPWLDIAVLAALHVWRVLAGGIAAGIAVSAWLSGFAFALFLALAALKRLAELRDLAGREAGARAPGRGWATADAAAVEWLAVLAGGAAVAVLGFYAPSAHAAALYARPALLWLLCPALGLWLWHLLRVTRRGRMGDDPLVFGLADPWSWLALGGLAAALVAAA